MTFRPAAMSSITVVAPFLRSLRVAQTCFNGYEQLLEQRTRDYEADQNFLELRTKRKPLQIR